MEHILTTWLLTYAVHGAMFTALAFVAGLSVLVRPELALLGVVALLMLLAATPNWPRRILVLVAVPVSSPSPPSPPPPSPSSPSPSPDESPQIPQVSRTFA